jgi:hypothetical protein
LGFKHIESIIFGPNVTIYDGINLGYNIISIIPSNYKFAHPNDVIAIKTVMNNISFNSGKKIAPFDNLMFVKTVDHNHKDYMYEYNIQQSSKTIRYDIRDLIFDHIGIMSVYELNKTMINPSSTHNHNEIMIFQIDGVTKDIFEYICVVDINVLTFIMTNTDY